MGVRLGQSSLQHSHIDRPKLLDRDALQSPQYRLLKLLLLQKMQPSWVQEGCVFNATDHQVKDGE